MNDSEIKDTVLCEPLTEFTAEISVDIFDGNLVLIPIGWNGLKGFKLCIAGPVPISDLINDKDSIRATR